MKGVHCQIRAASMAPLGMLVIQSTCGGECEPNSRHTSVSRPLSRP